MARTSVEDAGSIPCKIRLLGREITACSARLLEPLDLTPSQSEFLYHLTHGQTSPSKIARMMGIDASNLSRMIRQFEQRGLIKRKADEDNRTRVALIATAAGRALAKASDPHAYLIRDTIKQTLSDSETRSLLRSMRKLSDALADLDAGDLQKPARRRR